MPAVSEALSEYGLRAAAERAGFPVTHAQLRDYQAWGLMPEGEITDLSSEDLIERLVAIRKLSASHRSLARRVIWLRVKNIQFVHVPIPAEKVQKAVIAVTSTMQYRSRKMKVVDSACRWWSNQASVIANRLTPTPRPGFLPERQLPPKWHPPQVGSWKRLLEYARPDWLDSHLGIQGSLAFQLLDREVNGAPLQISSMPLEELVVLLTIRDVSAWLTLSD